MIDTFSGDNAALIENIDALLRLDAAGALFPHGVGGLARQLLSAAAMRLAAAPPQPYCASDGACSCQKFADDPATCERSMETAEPVELTDRAIERGWRETFSTENPFCPCNLKSFTKAVRWAERAVAKGAA